MERDVVKIECSISNASILTEELNEIEGFRSNWVDQSPQKGTAMGQVELISLLISIPMGILTNAAYDLIKRKIQEFNDRKLIKIKEGENNEE
jgi:hypothetical protein